MIYQGDALEILRKLPDNSAQCCVTSPPYWGLRDYGVDGQLGQERTPEFYIAKLVEIFHEVKRVLKPDGVLWLNIGDTYVGSSQGWGQKPEKLTQLQKGNKGSLHSLSHAPANYKVFGLKKKDLVGIPWRVALALQADGWYLRSDVVWHKSNAMPESIKDRPTKAHEYIFLLTKSRNYYYDADAIREPHKASSLQRTKHEWKGNCDAGRIKPSYAGMKTENMCHPKGRNKRTVWTIATAGFRGAHFATFPSEIPSLCIKAGSRPGDVVLDPFAGSGTTLIEAVKLGRDYLGIELNKKYIKSIIIPRVKQAEDEVIMNKLFGYPGGKWPIRHLIVSNFPPHESYDTFVDLFGGSGAIFISTEHSKGEIFNDKNQEIINFFRVVKHRPAELTERAKHWIHSRQFWYELKGMPPPEDEVERAFRFWALLADSFGGRGENFGTTRTGIRSVTHARDYLDAVAKRLKDVQVECLDFQACIKKFDSPRTFFYLDPPYRGTKGGNTNYNLLTDEEWEEMKRLLDKVEGKFLLSHTTDSFVLRLFKDYRARKINVRVTLPRSKKAQMREEVLISNYPLQIPRKKKHKVVYASDRTPHHTTGPRMVKEPKMIYNIKESL